MGECQKYVEQAQKQIDDGHEAILAIFHCLEFMAQKVDELEKSVNLLRR